MEKQPKLSQKQIIYVRIIQLFLHQVSPLLKEVKAVMKAALEMQRAADAEGEMGKRPKKGPKKGGKKKKKKKDSKKKKKRKKKNKKKKKPKKSPDAKNRKG